MSDIDPKCRAAGGTCNCSNADSLYCVTPRTPLPAAPAPTDPLPMVQYEHGPKGTTTFKQYAKDPIPTWAHNVREYVEAGAAPTELAGELTGEQELMVLIDRYASKRALHSFIEASRVATSRKGRGPVSSEISAKHEADDLRATVVAHIRAALAARQAPAEPSLTDSVMDLLNNLYGAGSLPSETPQPFAGIIVLLETFAELGMTAKRDGEPTPNSLLCLRFAGELRAVFAARQVSAPDAAKEQKALEAKLKSIVSQNARKSIELQIIGDLIDDPEHEYDCGTEADYTTPLTDKVNKFVKEARSARQLAPDAGRDAP